MGVVWKAVDETLDRAVAIKVLPDAFVSDEERSARFRREAKLLASISHPNIGAIYGFEEDQGLSYIVLELIPGEDLDQRLKRTSLTVKEALRIGRQIAQALEAAHDRGIIHRDLKPGNVKITPGGDVKVLDFGLATVNPSPETSLSPTLSSGGTKPGTALGTAAYMSPEQARGRPLDKRTDIWSFGCVMFECLARRRPFDGDSLGDVMVSILEREPRLELLPPKTPIPIARLLGRCLRKDAPDRLRDIGDARIVLSDVLASGGEELAGVAATETKRAKSTSWRIGLAAGVVGLLAGAALVGPMLRGPGDTPASGPASVVHAEIALPAGSELAQRDNSSLAVSPDGRWLAFVTQAGEAPGLYIRALDGTESTRLSDLPGITGPFFSPDSQWVGFIDYSSETLRKVSVNGGAATVICDTPAFSRGADWGPNDRIVFAKGHNSGLFSVPASGGAVTAITERRPGEKTHRFPEVLPDGSAVVFVIGTTEIDTYDEARIAVVALDSGEVETLIEGGTHPRYVPTGHLLYSRDDALYAVPFDLDTRSVDGSPVRVLEGLVPSANYGSSNFDVSKTGTAAYVPGLPAATARRVVRVDRRGSSQPLTGLPSREYQSIRVSPDGTRLALGIEAANASAWVYDLERRTLTRATSSWDNHVPHWTPDGERLVFSSNRDGEQTRPYWKAADGSGQAELLIPGQRMAFPGAASSDGRYLAFLELSPDSGADIWLLTLDGQRHASKLLGSPYYESEPVFSPDGNWLGYLSDESGRRELYVTSLPDARGRWQISNSGAQQPLWSRDGSELFFIEGDRMMVVPVRTVPSFEAGVPRELFQLSRGLQRVPFAIDLTAGDLTADGQAFLLLEGEESVVHSSVQIVLNWFDELRRRVATTN